MNKRSSILSSYNCAVGGCRKKANPSLKDSETCIKCLPDDKQPNLPPLKVRIDQTPFSVTIRF